MRKLGLAKRTNSEAPLVRLLPYQQNWLRDKARLKIGMLARQCGKTKFMAAPEVVEDVLWHESRGMKARWLILSVGERQAVEAIEEGIKPWCASYGAAIQAYESDFQGESGIRYKAHEVSFGFGSRITCAYSKLQMRAIVGPWRTWRVFSVGRSADQATQPPRP